jgi:type IX secretion system PorP/SprF family membrane protein
MRRLIVILLFAAFFAGVSGQQDPKFSQNMFMLPYYNPGAVGSTNKICLLGGFRNQWSGLPDAPTITTFTAHMPFNLLGRSHGVGINLTNDRLGFQNDFLFNASYAFRIDLGNGNLGIGVNLGVANSTLEAEWFVPDGFTSPDGDQAIPGQNATDFAFDMGLGVYYNTDKLYVGLSSTHLSTRYKYRNEDDTETPLSLPRHYYLMAGYNLQLANPMFEILPSLMVQSDARSHHIYLNTNVRYNKRFWGGVSYSVAGALSALVGVELNNGLRIGYSYDFELSPLLNYNSGSHEITVRYCFDLSIDKSPSKYKSIRFL